jgi:dTDP-4-dehydrorhamnose reductase
VKVVVIGANGQLGGDVCRQLLGNGDVVVGLTHGEIEVSSLDDSSKVLKAIMPDVVVNTSAFHHVEKCEADPEKAFAVNGLGARNLALVGRDVGSVLIHVSTDYVFDGAKKLPYVEGDTPVPLNAYGCTKLAGEHFIRAIADKYFIVRTSALYGKDACRAKGGLNFVELMLKLARERSEVRVVDDEVITPTSTAELAKHIACLTRFDGYGVYHATAEGSCSWYECAREIFSCRGITTRLTIAGPGEFPAKVPRPSYSVLENGAFKANGINSFKPWEIGLREYLAA